jgi:hypothetical protein
LDKLHQLAGFQGTQNNFDARVKLLVEKYKAHTALMGRWKRKGWVYVFDIAERKLRMHKIGDIHFLSFSSRQV